MQAQILAQYTQPVPFDKSSHLYCYAVIRGDLDMPAGKLSAQAGHAYGDALDLATAQCPELKEAYRNRASGGSKVTLKSKTLNHLLRAYQEALAAGIPAVVIVDQNHVLPPHFTGEPIITAIGIGPCTQAQARDITKRFQCV